MSASVVNVALAEELFGSFPRWSDSADQEQDTQRLADIEAAWRGGHLEYKLEPHQYEVYELFAEWNARRLTEEYAAAVVANDATLDDVWVEEIARRFGKTAKWIIILACIAIQRPGAVLTYACAFQKDIGDIIVPLQTMLLADGPDDLRPSYRGSQGASHEGLYFPNGSVIKLVGIDKHPDALRGRFSDGVVISEAGFVKGLEQTVRAVLLPQFQRRPWAFLALESSAPRQIDHDFREVFVPDSTKRAAYVTRTIDDNHALDERDKIKYIRQAGGRGHPVCELEYYNTPMRDPEQVVIPEFDERQHVREHIRPAHAVCMTAADPGSRDLYALVFGYWDFLAARAVIQASWAKRNPSTRQVACVVAFYEFTLWGKWPHKKLAGTPLRRSEDRDGWIELLAGVADAAMCEELKRMAEADDSERPVEMWVSRVPPAHFGYWDGSRYKQNPHRRYTDIALMVVHDLSVEYGLTFANTAKDDADAQRNAVRDAVGGGRMHFLPTAGPVIEHVRNAIWNDKRTDYERHKVYGHFDCLAALIYWLRNVAKHINPSAPEHVGVELGNNFVAHVTEQRTQQQKVVDAILNIKGRKPGAAKLNTAWRRT